MQKQPRHRPRRRLAEARRILVECELNECVHCGVALVPRKPWHARKYVQTMKGPVFVAGKSKECANPDCEHVGHHYYATGVLAVSLPWSTYGLDVLAFIGWRHEHEHRQLVEIQRELNQRGILINERTVGKLYRQFLALLGGMNERKRERLEAAAKEHGGSMWALDALQPEGCGSLLYVLYEVLSGTPVSAIQLSNPTATRLSRWLEPYKKLSFGVLATLSDGEKGIVAALRDCWPEAPHQLCQLHFLNRVAEPAMEVDALLRQRMRDDLGGLRPVPEYTEKPVEQTDESLPEASPPFCLSNEILS